MFTFSQFAFHSFLHSVATCRNWISGEQHLFDKAKLLLQPIFGKFHFAFTENEDVFKKKPNKMSLKSLFHLCFVLYYHKASEILIYY